jgi:hypothetical protein
MLANDFLVSHKTVRLGAQFLLGAQCGVYVCRQNLEQKWFPSKII